MCTRIYPRPGNFQYQNVFFDDGDVALIVGNYKGDPKLSLGLRWHVTDTGNPKGFPLSYGNQVWLVIPDEFAGYIVQGLRANPTKQIIDVNEFNKALAAFSPSTPPLP